MMRRALALAPEVAAYPLDLAEVYLAVGEFERAIHCGRLALRLEPESAGAAYVLGRVFLAEGRFEEAANAFREAIRHRADFALAHNNLANVLRELRDGEGAVAHFRRACELAPDRGELHSNLGQFLLERGEPDEALHHCREAVRLLPGMAEAHCNLGNVLRDLGELDGAKQHYHEALRLNPGLAMVYNNLGQALQEEGKLDEATAMYERAVGLEPGSARFHTNLADVLAEQEKYDDAQHSFERALRHDRNYFQAHSGLGMLLREQGHYSEARAHFQEVLRLRPEQAGSHCSLGEIAEEMGDPALAESCFREAIRLDPVYPGAYAQLANLLRGRLPEEDQRSIRDLIESPKIKPLGRASLLHGLAQYQDSIGDHAAAAEGIRRAKGIQQVEWTKRNRGYSPSDHREFVDGVISTFDAGHFDRVRGFGVDSERPVFIFGLPRSGTTLVEQILAAHPDVFAAGELRLAQESFRSLPALIDPGLSPLESVRRVQPAHARSLAERHLQALLNLDRAAARVTDKMPDNYLQLGLLATLFPRARFIHCRRDLRDVAVSCWSINFRSIRWNADFDAIAARFQEYWRLMEHWRLVLPAPMLEVSYEDTVADLETAARRVVAWCGLAWDPCCLNFHEVRRPVRTASVNQVRKPLYRSSVGRWKHYQDALATLFERLPG